MMIWGVLAAMTAAAVLAVLYPLSRRPRLPVEVEADRRFYEDQLAEIDRDQARGLLQPTEAEAARIEAARRLLRSTSRPVAGSSVNESSLRRRRAVSALALSTVPLLAITVYGAYGSPQIPAQPLYARQKAAPAELDLATAIAQIESHLAKNPQDGRGYEVVAPVYLRLGRFEDAVKAYRAALRLQGETALRLANLGEALVTASDGAVPAEARVAFERALALEPGFPKARFFLALTAEQDGDRAEAKRRYEALVSDSPSDAPWLPTVRARLARLEGPGAPARPQVDQAAIRGMVDGLAARLDQGGGSLEEWSRLIRSFVVLNERERAREALDKARRVHGEAPNARATLATLARELGLETAEARP